MEVASTQLSLGKSVRERMADGFQPLGPLVVTHTQRKGEGELVPALLVAQAMVKYTAMG